MASIVVDGLIVPVSVAGHAALDFCNTRAGWGSPGPKEYLHTHAHLCVWARENGLIAPSSVAGLRRDARGDAAGAERVVARAVVFRSALYAVLVGPGENRAWDAVNLEVRAAAASSALAPSRPTRWELTDLSTLELPLLAVAWAAADLLTSSAATHVAACPGAGCGWVFTDPRGRRRWCSMAWCGNRNKVRRHAERRRVKATTTADQTD